MNYLHKKERNRILRLVLVWFLFLTPMIFFVPVMFFYPLSKFPWKFFLTGSLVEWISGMSLHIFSEKLQNRRLHSYLERLILTVIGLPLTVILISTAPHGYAGLIRLYLSSEMSLLNGGIRGLALHISFFFTGYLVFVFSGFSGNLEKGGLFLVLFVGIFSFMVFLRQWILYKGMVARMRNRFHTRSTSEFSMMNEKENSESN